MAAPEGGGKLLSAEKRPRRVIPSLRRAINAKCRDCIYDNAEPGTWRAQVRACTIEDCPLWPVRLH